MPEIKNGSLVKDILIITGSIIVALILLKTKSIDLILLPVKEWGFIGSFIAGLFFTSVFTTAPAIIALGEISHFEPVLSVAFFGAIGAVLGDLVIFKFIRDGLSEHLIELYQHQKMSKRIQALFQRRYVKWLTFLIGGIIIASPLPDELGISMLGLSKMKTSTFLPIAFFLNFLGIICIGVVANSF